MAIFEMPIPKLNAIIVTFGYMQRVSKIARALERTNIDIGGRKHGAHSLRASLASSMVNDGIPYEAVRKTLGHSDLNSTKCYARLDLEQLRPYALSPSEASGFFLEFLMGRRCVE